MRELDAFVVLLGVVAFGIFFLTIAVPLWRSMRAEEGEGLESPPAPNPFGIEGPRRRS